MRPPEMSRPAVAAAGAVADDRVGERVELARTESRPDHLSRPLVPSRRRRTPHRGAADRRRRAARELPRARPRRHAGLAVARGGTNALPVARPRHARLTHVGPCLRPSDRHLAGAASEVDDSDGAGGQWRRCDRPLPGEPTFVLGAEHDDAARGSRRRGDRRAPRRCRPGVPGAVTIVSSRSTRAAGPAARTARRSRRARRACAGRSCRGETRRRRAGGRHARGGAPARRRDRLTARRAGEPSSSRRR